MATYTKLSIYVAVVSCIMCIGVGRVAGDVSDALPCVEKLKPCQTFLNEHSAKPTPECCEPLEQVMDKETVCLCTLFENEFLLHTVNITREGALDLAKACGSKPNPSLCKTGTPGNGDAHTADSKGSSSGNSPSSESRKNAGYMETPFSALIVVICILGLFM